MWMMGYEGGEINMVEHSLSTGRKLKPLMPRPMTTTTTPSLSHIHGNDFLSQYRYHHLGMFMFNLCVCGVLIVFSFLSSSSCLYAFFATLSFQRVIYMCVQRN